MDSNSPVPAAKPKIHRRFTAQDITFIADAVALGNTETEAVLRLNKQPKQWFKFKSTAKRAGKFSDILTRMKGDYISGNIEEIKKAASGRGGVRHDWRAADRLNCIIAPERFAQRDGQASTTTNVLITGGAEHVKQLIAMFSGQAKAQVEPPANSPALQAPGQDDLPKPIDV